MLQSMGSQRVKCDSVTKQQQVKSVLAKRYPFSSAGNLLLQQCLDRTDQGMCLLLVSDHPPTSFLGTTFGTIFSSIVCLHNQLTLVLSLVPYCRSNQMSYQVCQNYSPKVKATPMAWSTCICKSPTFTSLQASILTLMTWLQNHFFCKLAQEMLRAPQVSQRCKTNAIVMPSPRRSQDEQVKP